MSNEPKKGVSRWTILWWAVGVLIVPFLIFLGRGYFVLEAAVEQIKDDVSALKDVERLKAETELYKHQTKVQWGIIRDLTEQIRLHREEAKLVRYVQQEVVLPFVLSKPEVKKEKLQTLERQSQELDQNQDIAKRFSKTFDRMDLIMRDPDLKNLDRFRQVQEQEQMQK